MTSRVREVLQELSPELFRELSADQVTHKFTEVAQEIGLQGMKLHSLRHTFGTFLIALGYDIVVVKELMGHADLKTTMVYAKANTRLLREAIQTFDKLGRGGYKMVTKGEDQTETSRGQLPPGRLSAEEERS